MSRRKGSVPGIPWGRSSMRQAGLFAEPLQGAETKLNAVPVSSPLPVRPRVVIGLAGARFGA